MKAAKPQERKRLLKHLTFWLGLILVLNMLIAGVFFIPALISAGGNDEGRLRYFLKFDDDYTCQGDCYEIRARVCNVGEDMRGSSSYEIWHRKGCSLKKGALVGKGDVPALKSGECSILSYIPSWDGNYEFRIYDWSGHYGQRKLWSKVCKNIKMEQCREPVCGDGIKEGNEQCDDGNRVNGDGCSAECSLGLGINPGNIIINEIMNNPAVVLDSYGEWFEIYNPTNYDIDLQECNIRDNGTNFHKINSSLVVLAQSYLVLARNGDPNQNGGFTADYVYGGSFVLGNEDDEVILTCGDIEIDRVEYDGGPQFPDPTGKSMILKDSFLDNNVGANWCLSRSPFGLGNLGTPRKPNDICYPE